MHPQQTHPCIHHHPSLSSKGSVVWMGVANPSEDLLIEGRIPKGTVHPDILPLLHGRRLGHLKDIEVGQGGRS